MIRLLRGDRNGLDFIEPVRMMEVQKAALLDFLRNMFAVVDEEEVTEFRHHRLGEKPFPRLWSSEELALLPKPYDVEEVSRRLGRSWMSVTIKRGAWVGGFLEWVGDKEYDLARDDLRRLIDEYLEEGRKTQGERRAAKADKRKRLKQLEKEVEQLKGKRKMRELQVRTGQETSEIIEEVEQEIRDAEKRLADFRESEGLQ